jgi:hypothetical protein
MVAMNGDDDAFTLALLGENVMATLDPGQPPSFV